MDTPRLDLGDLSLGSGDHVCAFYRGDEERDALLMPYLTEGLMAGDKCIYVGDSGPPATIRAALETASHRPAGDGGDDARLDLLSSEEAYLAGGSFSSTRMVHSLHERVSAILSEETFTFVRLAGDMSWAVRDVPGVEQLLTYETALKGFYDRYPVVGICLYDLQRFRGDVIIDVLKTHPKVLIGRVLFENPYYVDPEDLLAGNACN